MASCNMAMKKRVLDLVWSWLFFDYESMNLEAWAQEKMLLSTSLINHIYVQCGCSYI